MSLYASTRNCCNTSSTFSCSRVMECVNRNLTRFTEDQSNDFVNFCQAISHCIDGQLEDYSEGAPNLLPHFDDAITTYLKSITGYTTTDTLVLSTVADVLQWTAGGGGGGSGTVTSVAAGAGMDFAIITTSGTVTLGTPSSVTLATTNVASGITHTHAFAPGGTTAQYIRGDGTLATFPTIATPTWQETLIAGSTLSQNNTITGGGFDFVWNNTKIGIDKSAPTAKLHILTDAIGVTQSNANGIMLENTTAANVSLNQTSPPIVFRGAGWRTNSGGSSVITLGKIDLVGTQTTGNPSAVMQFSFMNEFYLDYELGATMALGSGPLSAPSNNAGNNQGGAFNVGSVNRAILWRSTSGGNTSFGSATNMQSSLFTGTGNTVFGTGLLSATTGFSNVMVGSGMNNLTTGNTNTAVGNQALAAITDGISNVAIGTNALLVSTTAWKNVAVGAGAMEETTTGGFNVAVGEDAMLHNDTGINNVAIGWLSGALAEDGDGNVSIGFNAGTTFSAGDNNVWIGNSSGTNAGQATTVNNSIALGASTFTTASNQMVLGNSSIVETLISGAVTTVPTYFYGETAGGLLTKRTLAEAASDLGGLVVGTTTITSGAANRILFEDSSNVLGESANFTFTGSLLTLTGNYSQSSANTTQTTTSSAQVLSVNSLTTGTGMYLESSTLSSGKMASIVVTGTAGLTDQTGLAISMSGANGTSAQRTYGLDVSNTHTGTTSVNVAARFTATGGASQNIALLATGRCGFAGVTAPFADVDVGNGTIAAGQITITTSAGTNQTGNFSTGAQGLVGSNVGSIYQFLSSSTVNAHVFVGGTGAAAVTAGVPGATMIIGAATLVEASTGTHPLFAGLVVKAPTITAAAGAVTNTATCYIEGAPSASGATNYSLWVDSGVARFDGTLSLTGSSSGAAVLQAAAAAGSPTLTLPIVTGTLAQYVEDTTASSGTPTPTGDARDNFYDVTALATNPTFAAPSGTPVNHNSLVIRIKDNGTSRTLAFDAIYRAGTVLALPTSTTINKTMYLQFLYNSADSVWDFIGFTDGL